MRCENVIMPNARACLLMLNEIVAFKVKQTKNPPVLQKYKLRVSFSNCSTARLSASKKLMNLSVQEIV